MINKIFPVTCHTKHVGSGSTFVAIKGMQEDGVRYIPQAIAAGATTIVVDQAALLEPAAEQLMQEKNIALVRVADTRRALAELSAQAHGYPARQLTIIGITGTKGKSTTTFLVEHILKTAGFKTAMLSTVHNKILDVVYETELTTQHPDYIHAFLQQCIEQGVTHVVMEVAAQAFTLHRVATIEFSLGMFLNFSHEHGEFYATQDDYFAAKCSLFSSCAPDAKIIIPEDDARICSAAVTYGIASDRILKFSTNTNNNNAATLAGIQFVHENYSYSCPALVGNFNIYNVRAAILCAQEYGVVPETIQQALRTFTPVPGRLNKYELGNGAVAFIDYAHNPASFEHVLRMVRGCADHLVVVFGAGGDRDRAKRPLMGALAVTYADHIILTTDNPRSEDPQAINRDIMAGVAEEQRAKVTLELDRERAIRLAYQQAGAGSIIMLLGKGPDEYQLIKGVKSYFSEQEILSSLMAPQGAPNRSQDYFTKKPDTVD